MLRKLLRKLLRRPEPRVYYQDTDGPVFWIRYGRTCGSGLWCGCKYGREHCRIHGPHTNLYESMRWGMRVP